MRPAVTRVLSFHAHYACRRTGACCTAGWPIAAEARVEAAVRGALATGKLRLPLAAAPPFVTAPGGGPKLLGHDPGGRCAFFVAGDPNGCALHHELGHQWLPLACRQFPRVSLLTPGAVSISLSHYCPTAAALLFGDDPAFHVVEDAPAFPAQGEYEGLDARGALPLLRPGVFLDWESHRKWEEHAVATLARADLSPETALARLAADAELARAWTPARGLLWEWIATVAAASNATTEAAPVRFEEAVEVWRRVASCVPSGAPSPPALDAPALAESDARFVAPAWPAFARPVRRYLAAKAFGSWCAVQGGGLRTAVAYLATALSVLRVEAARACLSRDGRAAPLLTAAVRASDLLLVHLVSPEALAARLSGTEGRG